MKNSSQSHQIGVYEWCKGKATELGLIIFPGPELFSITNNSDKNMLWHNFDSVYELEAFINGVLSSSKLDQESIKKAAEEK